MSDTGLWLVIHNLLSDYADCLDSGRFEDWPAFFDPADCRYEIRSRENVELNLPAAIMYCDTYGMLTDRITLLTQALTYRKLYLRHFISNIRIHTRKDTLVTLSANYQVMQSDDEGVTTLFNIGQYRDEVLLRDDKALFRQKIVITDTFGIDNMLAVPL